jgi:flagellar hook-basal body complex protein FliE
MTMAIDRIASTLGAGAPAAGHSSPADAAAGAADFGAALKQVLGTVNASTADANQAVGNMIEGTGDVHEAMIALQRADMMLELTVQIRNKVVQAYQDVMRMPV